MKPAVPQETFGSADDRGPVSADINDSDEFFQNAIKTGPERDNSQKIEALLKRMTLEEKVGQMTQLTIGMIVNGQDQNIQIDPAKLDKAIVKYGVGSILNVSDQALTPDKWHDIIRQIQDAAQRKRGSAFRSSMASIRSTAQTTCRAQLSFRRKSAWPPPGIRS